MTCSDLGLREAAKIQGLCVYAEYQPKTNLEADSLLPAVQ